MFGSVPPGKYVIVERDFATYDSTGDAEGANDNRIPIDMPPSGDLMARDFLDSGYELCDDGIDNDFNDATDCEDEFCENLPSCTRVAPMLSPQMIAALVALLAVIAAWGLGRTSVANGRLR
jgi:hypothetical protein